MDILAGVEVFPFQPTLIAKDGPAFVRIDTRGHPGNRGYEKINERMFNQAIVPYLHGDWVDGMPCRLKIAPGAVAYSGAEHTGTPKQPNITVVPNWATQDDNGLSTPYMVMGCTMGHEHPPDPAGPRIQEIYEFLTSGLLVMDRADGKPEIWVAQSGDKVAVPDACHMTLYNLGESHQPLLTLDFADPARNPSDKTCIETCGPILLIYYDPFEVHIVLNRLYSNNPSHRIGVQPGFAPARQERCITIPRAGRMDLGQFLYAQLTGNPAVIGKFARLGLQIKPASPQATLAPVDNALDGKLSFTRPLARAAVPGSEVFTFFMPAAADARTLPRVQIHEDAFVQALARKVATVKRLTALQALNRPLVLLVQGAGEWVEKAFRPTFLSLVEDHKLSVFYADDTSWRGERPAWTRDLRPWEVYLDKANAHDLALYHNVLARVDAVFIATPDVTHAEVAKECVRRRVPTIFIEKPFDSHRANVEALGREMGFHYRSRAVLGIDHYMFYAAALRELMPDIQRYLGGALADVAFYMTETQPIERERERSLQYGLTLDMLPHMLALLTYFGSVHTVDDIRIVAAGQYSPLISQDKQGKQYAEIGTWYRHETYARVHFTYADYTGNRVPCLGVVGKGLAQEVKYLEVCGINGNAVRIDLGKGTESPTAYPHGNIFFLANPTALASEAQPVMDPYDSSRTLYILPEPMVQLDRERYKRLILDLLKGTDDVIANVLLFDEAYEIVKTLDRIWEAIQDAKPHWKERHLGKLVPVQPAQDC